MYVERHNDKSAIIFERFNGEDIKKGEEVFSKIKIKKKKLNGIHYEVA